MVRMITNASTLRRSTADRVDAAEQLTLLPNDSVTARFRLSRDDPRARPAPCRRDSPDARRAVPNHARTRHGRRAARSRSDSRPGSLSILMPRSGTKMSRVRTTVRIDDDLYRRVSSNGRPRTPNRCCGARGRGARRNGRTRIAGADRFVLVPTGEGGLQPGVELSSNAALREILDEGLDVDMLR